MLVRVLFYFVLVEKERLVENRERERKREVVKLLVEVNSSVLVRVLLCFVLKERERDSPAIG